MYGLIVKLTATAGRRQDLIQSMGGEDSHTIPGCLSFIVAKDAADDDILWITEVWVSRQALEASLERPNAQAAASDFDTLIAAYEKAATTSPVEGSSHPFHCER